MNNGKKIVLIIATFLIVFGAFLFLLGFACTGFSFKKAFSKDLVEETYEISQSFENISIDGNTQDIEFIKSTDGVTKVVTYEHKDLNYSVCVEGNTLKIGYEDERNFVEKYLTSDGFADKYIKVYLANDYYGSLEIDVDTADTDIPKGFTFKNVKIDCSTGDVDFCADVIDGVEISISTGDVEIENATLGSLKINGSTSDIELDNVTVNGKIDINVSTGEVLFESAITAESIDIKARTGKVKCEGVLETNGVKVQTSTGDVTLKLVGETSDYNYSYNTSTGKSNIPAVTNQNPDAKSIYVKTSTGDIDVYFIK